MISLLFSSLVNRSVDVVVVIPTSPDAKIIESENGKLEVKLTQNSNLSHKVCNLLKTVIIKRIPR